MAKPFAALNSSSKSPTVDEAPILHADLDAFFASVEVLDDPSLRASRCGGRRGRGGVIASASYEGVVSECAARCRVLWRNGLSALVILPGRFDRYEIYSRKFHDVVRDLTPDFEPLGLDEVFADLRSLRRLGIRPLDAAASLRARINGELDCSVGWGLVETSSSRSWPRRSPSPRR